MPWPLDDGGLIGLWQALWSCAREWDTTLVSLVAPGDEREPVPDAITALGVEVVRVPHRPPPMPVAALRGVFGRWPYTLARYRSRRLEETLRDLLAARAPEFVLFNHLHMLTALDAAAGTVAVLREHNLEHRWLARYANSIRQPLVRAYAHHQAWRMQRVETRLCARCDLVLAMHDPERDVLRRLVPGTRVETVPVGVDFARFLPRAPESPPVVLLTGSFVQPMNPEGARRFVLEGWPRVRARVPGVRLRIVGKSLPADLAGMARAAGAEPVGYVEDIAPEFSLASVMVVPLWVGAGARVKIVESLAAGLPVVSTPLGAEGLGLQSGRECLVADTPAALADALVSLLLDPAGAATMAAAGHAVARDRFSLEAVARLANRHIAEVVGRRRSGPGAIPGGR
jgi:glycosyltransferase involved in cell wall biosynthesis